MPNVATKTITLNTFPAQSVASVGGGWAVSASSSFAPEDHVHDLFEGAVEGKHLSEGIIERRYLGEDVYANLIQGTGRMKVKPDASGRTIRISTDLAPADDIKQVGSVTGTKRVGKSERYAREDHAHDLYINGHSPNSERRVPARPRRKHYD